jgi:hypothetical protein
MDRKYNDLLARGYNPEDAYEKLCILHPYKVPAGRRLGSYNDQKDPVWSPVRKPNSKVQPPKRTTDTELVSVSIAN